MSAFRSPPSANNPERAPCFTPTDGAARRGPPRCAENGDPFLLISSHSTPTNQPVVPALQRARRQEPRIPSPPEPTGMHRMAGFRPAERLCGRPVAAVVLLAPSYPPLPLGEGWGEGVRRAGVDRRSCGGRNLAARGPRLFQGAPKCAIVGHATPAGAPNRGRSPPTLPAIAVRRHRPAYVAMGRPR